MVTASNVDGVPYGKRLLPAILDAEAAANPSRIYAAIHKAADLTKGFRDVTFAEVANVTDSTAKLLQKHFGAEKDRDFETLTFSESQIYR